MRVLVNAKSAKILVVVVALLSFVGNQNMVKATSKVVKDASAKIVEDASSRGVSGTSCSVARGASARALAVKGSVPLKPILNVKELSTLTQLRTTLGAGLDFHELKLPSGTRAYAVVVDTKNGAWSIAPSINEPMTTTTKSTQANNAWAAINGGYFNMSDGDSVSFVTVDGKQICDPKTNKALIENEKLKPFLPQIFNREEFRVYADKNGKRSYAVEKHDAPFPAGSKLIHALQGGPMLLPAYTARDGAFVRTDDKGVESDSIGTSKPAARTALGITSDAVVLLVVEGRRTKEFSTGATLTELADFFAKIGCTQALNFDGGTSTTLVVKLPRGTDSGSQSESSSQESNNGGKEIGGDSSKQSGGSGPWNGGGKDPSDGGSQAEAVNNLKVAGSSSRTSVLKTIFSSSPERRVKSVLIVTPSK